MTRTILVVFAAAVFAAGLLADKHTDLVKDLGDETKRAAAVESLAKAGTEAFDALLEGLKTERKGEGEELRKNSQVRVYSARLLGTLADTRAAAELLKCFKAEATETAADPEFAAACATSLGQIWAAKPGDAGRKEAATALKESAANEKLSQVIRLGCLYGLAGLADGGDIAAPLVKNGAETVIRSAAIGVVVACAHKASADDLLDIWETQRLGPKDAEGKRAGAVAADYTKPLGLQALLGLAALGDKRCVDGLVDVVTRNEFYAHSNLRTHCTTLLGAPALKPTALEVLPALLKNEEAAGQWRQAATALGDLGADGVKALLAVADEKPPEGKDPAHYRTRVDQQLSSLTSETALKAFVAAWGTLSKDEANKGIRDRVLTQLVTWRRNLRDEGVQVFREAANDTTLDDAKRAQCVDAYSESRGKDSFEELKVWITDAKPAVREQAVQNLGRSYIAITKSKPLLLEVLTQTSTADEMAKVRQNALQGLQRSNDKADLQVFLDAMNPEKEKSAEVRRAAITALQTFRSNAKVKEEDLFEPIKARVNDADANVRATALPIAAGMAGRVAQAKMANEMIEKALKDSSEEVRIAAYGQVGVTARDVKLDALVDAALLETSENGKRQAVQALSQFGSMAALGDKQNKVDALVDLGVGVAERQAYTSTSANTLMKKLSEDAGAFNSVSTKTIAAIDRNVNDTSKQYARAAALVPILTEIKELTAIEKIKKLAQEPDVSLRQSCVRFFSQHGNRDDIAFLRGLMDRSDNAAAAVKNEIESAIRGIEDKG